jgi:hypothetical protein
MRHIERDTYTQTKVYQQQKSFDRDQGRDGCLNHWPLNEAGQFVFD